MTIQLDHAIVPSHNQVASAKLLAELLGVPWAAKSDVGPFSPVYVNSVSAYFPGLIMPEILPTSR